MWPYHSSDYEELFSIINFLIYVLGLKKSIIIDPYKKLPIIVGARSTSKAWTVFARSNVGIVGSNPTRGMDV
jgi:hypothetical protein